MKTGVYILKQNNKVVYVGATQKWPERLNGHRRKKFNSYEFIECEKSQLAEMERGFIAEHNPKYNKSAGGTLGRNLVNDDEKKIGVTLYLQKGIVKKHGGRTGVVIAINERLTENPL